MRRKICTADTGLLRLYGARAAVTGDEAAGIAAMLTGMGSLSYGETAGERMKLGKIKIAAEAGFSYDQMLAPGSEAGAALINGGVDALVTQTRSTERATAVLGLDKIGVEGSDSLDNPKAVFE